MDIRQRFLVWTALSSSSVVSQSTTYMIIVTHSGLATRDFQRSVKLYAHYLNV